jgi:UDP-N-acetylglucosamine acyltransferase
MTSIHPSAIIDPRSKIGANVTIGPYCVIGGDVTLGDNVELKSHVVIDGRTTIGENSKVFSFAVLGATPQDLKFHGEQSELIIGKNNTIREHVTMHPGTAGGGMKTVIGDNCLFMVAIHVAHDCQIGNHVIMANNATLAGHVVVGDHVLIGGLSAVHQFIRIGSYAVIGGMSGVESDVIPFGRVKGERASLAGLNLIGLERGGFDKSTIKILNKATRQLFDENLGTFEQRLSKMTEEYEDYEVVMQVIKFAREKERFGLCQPERRSSAA